MYLLIFFKYICYFNFSLNYTTIGDICFYLYVTMETVANKLKIFILSKNPDDTK